MLFYTHKDEPESQEATIHNIDTGITYKLDLQTFNGAKSPVVEMSMPGVTARRLYRGEQAVEFWRALLFRNPWTGTPTSPRAFLDELVGMVEGEPEGGDPF
jgi:hypothetical protein